MRPHAVRRKVEFLDNRFPVEIWLRLSNRSIAGALLNKPVPAKRNSKDGIQSRALSVVNLCFGFRNIDGTRIVLFIKPPVCYPSKFTLKALYAYNDIRHILGAAPRYLRGLLTGEDGVQAHSQIISELTLNVISALSGKTQKRCVTV